jgi:NADH:ubiquinone oxidoreductase subunit 6 (subunit J)
MSLVVTTISLAVVYVVLDAPVAALQIMVYAGAIVVVPVRRDALNVP